MADFNDDTIRDLNESIRELTNVMQSVMGASASSQGSFNKATDAAAASTTVLSAKTKISSDQTQKAADANKKLAEVSYTLGQSFSTLADATKMGSSSILSFGKAMTDSREGLAKYGAAINQASGALSAGLSAFGPLGRVLGTLLKPLTMMVEGVLGFQDNLFEAKDELAKFGAAGRFTSEDIRQMGLASGYTSTELLKYTKMVNSAGVGLVGLGGTVNSGVAEFAKLTKITTEQRNQFQRLGVSLDDYVQNTADFVKLQTMSGRMITEEMKTSGYLQRSAKEYTENLLVLSALSGESVQEQKQKQLQLAQERESQIADLATSNKIRELEKGNAADRQEAARLQKKMDLERSTVQLTSSVLGMDAAKSLQHFLKTGVYTPETMKIMRNTGMTLEELRSAFERGEDVGVKFVDGMAKADLQLIESQGLALQLSKEYADGMGINSERLAKLAALQGKSVEETKAQIEKDIVAKKLANDDAEKQRNERTNSELIFRTNIDNMAKSLSDVVVPALTELTKFMAKMSDEIAKIDFKKVWADITEFFNNVKTNFDDFMGYLKIAGLGLAALGGMSLMSKGQGLGGLAGGAAGAAGLAGAAAGGMAVGEGINQLFEAATGGISIGSKIYDWFGPKESGTPLNQTPTIATDKELDTLFNFTSKSGSKENFLQLKPMLRHSLVEVAREYNSTTGKKITINSAARSSEDQQRLYDETVNAGRPGKGPTGMAVARPGNSLHEKGMAVDIQEHSDSTLDKLLERYGLNNMIPGDPVHYTLGKLPGARLGGSFSGPNSGYPVMLHGAETVVPTPNPSTSLIKVEGDAATDRISSAMSGMNSDALRGIMEELYSMMEYKLTEMVDKLSTSNDLQDKLLKVQM